MDERGRLDRNRRLLRARDAIDRAYDQPLDLAALAAIAHLSPSHFTRSFRAAFGETPHRYLQRRRIERAGSLLRDTTLPVIDVCVAVGFSSPATFARTFKQVTGETPAAHRARGAVPAAPSCFAMAWQRAR